MKIKYNPILSFLFLAGSVHAQPGTIFTQPLPDTDKFDCKYCPEPEEKIKQLEVGLGINTEKSAKFSEYNGQDGNHLLPLIDAQFLTVNDENQYYSLETRNLGLASREINLGFGEFGTYDVKLNYDQITRYQFENLQTEFSGVNTQDLNLLSSGLVTYDYRQERFRLNTQFKYVFNPRWETIVDYQIENRKGLRPIGAAIYPTYISARSVILPLPVDQITQQFKAGVSFRNRTLQFEGGYKASLFNNSHEYLRWENPFSFSPGGIAVDSEVGQLALAPDNQHHQLYGLGALQLNQWLKFKGQLSIGRMIQDQDFLSYTINPLITNEALPRDSLQGEVDTLIGNLRASVNLQNNISMNANVYVDRKDNNTPRATYNYVTLDTLPGGTEARTNTPYTYHKYGADVSGSYRYALRNKVSTGYKYTQISRTYSDASKTRNHELWAMTKNQLNNGVGLRLKAGFASRTADDYINVQSTQNPLMRKYYLADRDRQTVQANIDYSGLRNVLLDTYLSYAVDDYGQSKIGLYDATDLSYGINASGFVDDINLNLFFSQERLDSRQRGAADSVQWKINNVDTFSTLGASAEWREFIDDLDLGLEYQLMMADSEIESSTSSSNSSLPNLETRRHTLQLYARYQYDENLLLKGAYLFEYYDESDWHVDGLAYDSVTNLRGLGYETFSYNVHFITVSMVYQF